MDTRDTRAVCGGERYFNAVTQCDGVVAGMRFFDHMHEEAHPGYYTVTLGDGIEVALTATDRAGIARIHFPQGSASRLLVNSGGSANSDVHIGTLPPVGREHDGNEIKVTDDNAITGST